MSSRLLAKLNRRRRRVKVSRLRVAFQVALHLLIAAHVAAWYLGGFRGVGGLDFQEFFHHFVGRGTVTAAVALTGALYLLALIFGRLFCSWGCHFGATQDLAAWILRRLGWRFRPVRTRWLQLGPWIVLLSIFIVPSVLGWLDAGWSLRIESGAAFAGAGPWERLPGWFLSAATFIICAGLILLFLGTRGFCRFVCPYGALFRITDRVAPWRVRRTKECAPGCASRATPPCTRACPTAIEVHDEVTRHLEVRGADCIRCHLCIEACPSDALRHTSAFGAGRVTAQADPAPARPAPRFSFTTGEEVLFLSVAAVTGPMIDLVYGGHFLAAVLALTQGFLAVGVLRIVRRADLRLGRIPFREGGKWRPAAILAFLLFGSGILLSLEAGAYRWLLREARVLGEEATRALAESPKSARGLAIQAAGRARAAQALFPRRPEPREVLVRAYEIAGDPRAVQEAESLAAMFPDREAVKALLRRVLVRFPPATSPGPDGASSPQE